MSEPPSFLRMSNILLIVSATFCLSIHPLADTWVASTFWLLWWILLWTRVYKYLFETLSSFLLCVYPEIDCWIIWQFHSSSFWGTIILFSTVTAPLYIPINSTQVSNSSTSSPTLILFCLFFCRSYANGCKILSHCGFELLSPYDQWCWASFMCFLAFWYPWRNVCSSPLSIKNFFLVVGVFCFCFLIVVEL